MSLNKFIAISFISLLLIAVNVNAATVGVFINVTTGIGQTIIDDTEAGPSISRSAIETAVGLGGVQVFAEADAYADLATASLGLKSNLDKSTLSPSVVAIASLTDTLTFNIAQTETDFITVGLRMLIDGTLYSSSTTSGSAALFNMDFISSQAGVGKSRLTTERQYGKRPSVAEEFVSIAASELFFERDKLGDFLPFNNSDFGLIEGNIRLYGAAPTLDINLSLQVAGHTDLFNTAQFEFFNLPMDATFTSESGAFLSAVPIPAAVWLFGSGLLGLIGLARRKR
jgi:hypothetical protein